MSGQEPPVVEKILRPSWDRPRCTATVKEATQRERFRNGESYICQRNAHVTVDGEVLCLLHAGEKLLRDALDK